MSATPKKPTEKPAKLPVLSTPEEAAAELQWFSKTHLGGRNPTTVDVKRACSEGIVHSTTVFMRLLGEDPVTKERSWQTVLRRAGFLTKEEREAAELAKLTPEEQAAYTERKEAEQQARLEEAERKQNFELQTKLAEAVTALDEAKILIEQQAQRIASLECSQQYEYVTVPTPYDNGIAGRTEPVAKTTVVNLLGSPALIYPDGKTKRLLPSGTIDTFVDGYSCFDDQVVETELRRVVGKNVQIKKARNSAYMSDLDRHRIALLPPRPGTYYLMWQRDAEFIGKTGRTMNDLVYPLEFHQDENGLITVRTYGFGFAEPRPIKSAK